MKTTEGTWLWCTTERFYKDKLIFRYNLEDYDGKMLADAESIRHKLPPFVSPYTWKDWNTGVRTCYSYKRTFAYQHHSSPS